MYRSYAITPKGPNVLQSSMKDHIVNMEQDIRQLQKAQQKLQQELFAHQEEKKRHEKELRTADHTCREASEKVTALGELKQKSTVFPNNHIFKISIFTKFTFSKSYISQNSHFQSLIFTKFTFFKHFISRQFMDKKLFFLSQCVFYFL